VDPYRQLAKVLVEHGIRCYLQGAVQMVVSTQDGLVLPDRGNSFWLTRAAGGWHLFTWASAGYRIPEGVDVARLCRSCVAHGSSAMARVPAHLAREFGLSELSDNEAESVYREMDKLDGSRRTANGDGRN